MILLRPGKRLHIFNTVYIFSPGSRPKKLKVTGNRPIRIFKDYCLGPESGEKPGVQGPF